MIAFHSTLVGSIHEVAINTGKGNGFIFILMNGILSAICRKNLALSVLFTQDASWAFCSRLSWESSSPTSPRFE